MGKMEIRLHICGKQESTEEILFPSEEDALAHPCLFSDLKLVGGMEDGSGSSHALPVGKESELQKLQRQHGEKMVRIQELKREIEAVKLRLEQRKSEVPSEKVEALKGLSDEYEKLREEYSTLVAERKSSEKLN